MKKQIKKQVIILSARCVDRVDRITIEIVDLDAFITADKYVICGAVCSKDRPFTCEKGDLSGFHIESVDRHEVGT